MDRFNVTIIVGAVIFVGPLIAFSINPPNTKPITAGCIAPTSNSEVIKDLEVLASVYQTSTVAQQETLRSVITHRLLDYNASSLPPKLQAFYKSLKENKENPVGNN